VTGYEVTPVVGVVPPDLALIPAEAEVAAVFEVPLAFLLDTANHVEATASISGPRTALLRDTLGVPPHLGATAAMIVNLSRRLRWSG
jgi:hypothetical protein